MMSKVVVLAYVPAALTLLLVAKLAGVEVCQRREYFNHG